MMRYWKLATILLVVVVALATVLATTGLVFGFPGMGPVEGNRALGPMHRFIHGEDVAPGRVAPLSILTDESAVMDHLAMAVEKGLITQAQADELLQWWQSRPEALMLTEQDLLQISEWWGSRPPVVMELLAKVHAARMSTGMLPAGFMLPEGATVPVDDAAVEALLAGAELDGVITQAQADELLLWWQARPEALRLTQEDVDAIGQWVVARPAVLDQIARMHKNCALMGHEMMTAS